MSSLNKIRADIEAHLNALTGLPQVAFDNVPYEQQLGTTYLRTKFTPTSTRPIVRGPNPQQRYQGFFSILICTPENLGSGSAYALADSICSHFQVHDALGAVAPFVNIEYVDVASGFNDAPFFCLPVTVGWFAHAQ